MRDAETPLGCEPVGSVGLRAECALHASTECVLRPRECRARRARAPRRVRPAPECAECVLRATSGESFAPSRARLAPECRARVRKRHAECVRRASAECLVRCGRARARSDCEPVSPSREHRLRPSLGARRVRPRQSPAHAARFPMCRVTVRAAKLLFGVTPSAYPEGGRRGRWWACSRARKKNQAR